MAADIRLSLSSRSNLLSLQNTSDLISRTSNRLATGQKVNSAIDDAPAFFASQSLSFRASDFTRVQSDIDQSIQSLQTALDGLKAVQALVENVQGLMTQLLNASDMTSSESLRNQYNGLLTQIDKLADNASYQGKNLINTGTETLGINFDENYTSVELTISASNATATGLNLRTMAQNQFFTNIFSVPSRASIASSTSVASKASIASRASVSAVDTQPSVASAASAPTFAAVASVAATASTPSAASVASIASTNTIASIASRAAVTSSPSVSTTVTAATVNSTDSLSTVASVSKAGTVATVNTSLIATTQARVQNALSQLRTAQATLGSNIAVLNIRLEFTKNYVNDLTTGSDKLTLADLNEEGANLTSLQTKQQLGTISLSISTQSEQSILRLF